MADVLAQALEGDVLDVLPVLVQHHYIRNRQRVSLEICRIVHIECSEYSAVIIFIAK